MKKKILIALLILGCTAGCGKVPKLSNGKEAVVSFEDTKISISADDLYNEIKEKSLEEKEIEKMKKILTEEKNRLK